jgi:hypothetical protein
VRTDPTTNKRRNTRRRPWPAAQFVLLGSAIALAAIALALQGSGRPAEPAAGRALPHHAFAAERSHGPVHDPQDAGDTRRRRLVNLVARDAARPVWITIPAVGVSAHVGPLRRASDGAMQTPTEPQETGWYKPGPEPGERGPAVIVGHVDWTDGPAIFYRLRELHRGNLITIRRADGSMLRFRVEGLERWPKSEFPTERVFGRKTNISALRLVTCSGNFDESTGHYVDNTIVYAARVPARRIVSN